MNRTDNIRRHNLYRRSPSSEWREGIPCGNGHEGVMGFGTADKLLLSLDRADLWYRGNREKPHRINAGSLVLPSSGDRFEEGLDIFRACAFRDTGAYRYEWFVHATRRLICVSVETVHQADSFPLSWEEPELWGVRDSDGQKYAMNFKPGTNSGLSSPYAGHIESRFFLEGTAGVIEYAVEDTLHFRIRVLAVASDGLLGLRPARKGFQLEKHGGRFTLLVSIDTTAADLDHVIPDPAPDYRQLLAEHAAWWAEYWNGAYITVNHDAADRYWHMGRYLTGSSMREDSVPVPLQGVWGEPSPPWWGAYTWDLNVQACYWPVGPAGSANTILALARWVNRHLDVFNDNARRMYGTDGLLLSLNTGLDGHPLTPLTGKISPSYGSWVCQTLWEYYRYTGSRDYLLHECLPPFKAHMQTLRTAWQKSHTGTYSLAVSESPELGMLNTPETPCRNSAYDIAFSRFLASCWLEMSRKLGLTHSDLDEFAQDFLTHAPAYPVSQVTVRNYFWPEDVSVPDYFVEWEGLETEMSHRHLSHLVNVYPLGELSSMSDPVSIQRLKNSMQRLQARGFGNWEPYSFAWASILNSRIGWRPRYSMTMLEIMNSYMTVPFNGLPLNDDCFELGLFNQTGPYGPGHLGAFTLESALIPMAAVQEAVVHTIDNHTRYGTGLTPDLEAEFHDIHLPGNRRTSGTIKQGNVELEPAETYMLETR